MAELNKNPSPVASQSLEGSRYPLSYAQQAMWFLYQLAPDEATYNMGFSARICSEVDVHAFQQTFQDLIDRHSSLRTTFSEYSGILMQEVHGHQAVQFEQIDASNWDENTLHKKVVEAYRKPFDLRHGPVARVYLFTRSQTEHVFLFAAHHIIFDTTSLWTLLSEFQSIYEAKTSFAPPSLPSLHAEYESYVQWERKQVNDPAGDRAWEYWQKQLAGELPVLNLPTDRPHPAVPTNKGASYHFVIEKGLAQTLKAIAQAEETTLYTTLLAAFQTLLYRYSGQDDFLVGSSVDSRSQSEFADLVGYMINVVVLRANLSNNPTFKSLLKRTHQTVQGMLEHQDYPFPLLVERLKPQRDTNRAALYQVFFDLQSVSGSKELSALLAPGKEKAQVDFGGLTLELYDMPQQEGLADLGLQMLETDDGLRGTFTYNADLFDEPTIARMSGHFLTLLSGIVQNPKEPVSTLPLLTETERHQLLVAWNNNQADYPNDQCIHELFEAQVEQSPDAVAVVFDDKQLTYRELNQRSNQLAHYLLSLGIKPETLIGISVDRSLDMIVAVMGVLKAGAAYMPLDPTYPQDRLAFMLEDTQVPVLLTQQHLLTVLPKHNARVICLDADWETIGSASQANPANPTTPGNLAYVIYTSGSTGKPKGALLIHRGLTNVTEAQIQAFGLGVGDHVLQFSTINFDASTFEIFMALRVGATLYLASKENLLPGQPLAQFIKDNTINIMSLAPSVLALLPQEDFPSLKIINVAGEASTTELLNRWVTNRRIFNLYGPTETTIWATIAEYFKGEAKPHIGRPIINTTTYILDVHLRPVPVGVPGELLIGGVGLACGYLNRPELTAQKFIPNPFSDDPEDKLYRTGDLVRYLPDGNIDFLGRIDHQVKIRGFRIELGEIEAILEQHPSVHEAATTVRERSGIGKQIVAYVRAEPGQQSLKGELQVYLKKRLPEYMMPSALVVLEAFPLSPSGKVDMKALPEPDQFRSELEENYVAPQTELEQTIARVWQEVLQLDKVGVHDNFFDLGGHSLLITQVHSKLSEALQLKDLPLVKLFQYTTISALAKYLDTQVDALPSRQVLNDRAARQKAALARQKQLMRKVKETGE